MRTPSHLHGKIERILPHPHKHKYVFIIKLHTAMAYSYIERPLKPNMQWQEGNCSEGEIIALHVTRRSMKYKEGQVITCGCWFDKPSKTCLVFKEATPLIEIV